MKQYACVLFDLFNTLLEDDCMAEREKFRLDGIFTVLEKAQYPVKFGALQEAYGDVVRRAAEREGDSHRAVTPFEQVEWLLADLKVENPVVFRRTLEVFSDAVLQVSPKPMRNAKKALEFLRERGIKTGLVSNTIKSSGITLRLLLKENGLLALLDDAVFSDEIGFVKPEPRIFALAAARLGVSPSECAFVGDLEGVDVQGAKDAGMDAVLFRRGEDDLYQLAAGFAGGF
jgi:putative hydrolase of the HAD superfamily